MAQNEEVMGDVVELPQEFLILRDDYTIQLNKRLVSLNMVRRQGGNNFIEIIDEHMHDIAGIKAKIKEVDSMMDIIKKSKNTGVNKDD
mgnify:CR=1 FL=1